VLGQAPGAVSGEGLTWQGSRVVHRREGAPQDEAHDPGDAVLRVVGDMGNPRTDIGRRADPDVEPQRGGYLGAEEAAEGLPGDPADELGHQPAVRQRVVAELRAGRGPGGRRRREPGRDRVVVVPAGPVPLQRRPVGSEAEDARGVGKDVPDQDGFLARLPELGPVPGHRCLDIEESAVDQELGAHGDQALGRRHHDRQVTAVPRDAWPGNTSPQVDHQLAVNVGGEAAATRTEFTEAVKEGLPDRLEAGPHRFLALLADHQLVPPIVGSASITE